MAISFPDREGNRLAAFVDSPWMVSQPRREPLAVASDAEIAAQTARGIAGEGSFAPRAAWREEFARTLEAGSR